MTTATIVITNHGPERFIGHAISSALAQTADGVEVVVVDDGSPDESRRIIEGYGQAIRAVFQEHRGQAHAMLAGFRASTGDVILFLDGDDLLYADAIARIRSRFRNGVVKTAKSRGVLGRREPSAQLTVKQPCWKAALARATSRGNGGLVAHRSVGNLCAFDLSGGLEWIDNDAPEDCNLVTNTGRSIGAGATRRVMESFDGSKRRIIGSS